jgi:hypothetical protein
LGSSSPGVDPLLLSSIVGIFASVFEPIVMSRKPPSDEGRSLSAKML